MTSFFFFFGILKLFNCTAYTFNIPSAWWAQLLMWLLVVRDPCFIFQPCLHLYSLLSLFECQIENARQEGYEFCWIYNLVASFLIWPTTTIMWGHEYVGLLSRSTDYVLYIYRPANSGCSKSLFNIKSLITVHDSWFYSSTLMNSKELDAKQAGIPSFKQPS